MEQFEKQKAYLFLYSNDEEGKEPLATIFNYDFPQVGEDVSIFKDGEFKFYKVIKRLYGINFNAESSVWNIYVIKKTTNISYYMNLKKFTNI